MSPRVGTRDRLVGVFQFNIEAPPIFHDDEVADSAASGNAGKNGETVPGGAKTDPMVIRWMEDLIEQRDRAAAEGKSFDLGDALQNALALQNQGFSSALNAITANLGKGDNTAMLCKNRKTRLRKSPPCSLF